MSTTELESRARRTYEIGRVRDASATLVVVAPLTAFSLVGCGTPAATIALGALLAVAAVAFAWRGQSLGHAVWPGLLAGIVPFTVPFLCRVTGHACFGGACLLLPLACIGGGIAAGIALGLHLARANRLASIPAAALLAALAGSLGCALVGIGGVGGMVVGLSLGAAPVAVLVSRRA